MTKSETMKKHALKIWIIAALLTSGALAYAAYQQRPFSHRMAAYVTDLKDRTEAQRINILRAGKMINGRILQPNEVFSFNDTAGPYTEERGFRPERSFRGQGVVNTPGGGVCQVASTLYNSVKKSGLEILERVPHSQAVSSVPRGLDATLAFGVADLKFRNNHPYPIQILARNLHDQLLIEIWGKETNDGNDN